MTPDTSRDFVLAWDARHSPFFLVLDESGRLIEFSDRGADATHFPTALDALRALIVAGETTPTIYDDPDWTQRVYVVYARRVVWH